MTVGPSSAILHRELCRYTRNNTQILTNSAHTHVLVPRIVHTILRCKISPQKFVSIFSRRFSTGDPVMVAGPRLS